MVSIRRRRLVGTLCSGRNAFSDPLPKKAGNATAPGGALHNSNNPVSVHPVPLLADQPPAGPSSISDSSVSQANDFTGRQSKRRKQQHRKQYENQEPCLMRGVYFKNMKWQAAIKVDRKQIHLGTVDSQEEAAHLYDRAAFMCGREPNFELPEEEKQELRKVKWDEFLAVTRHAISNRKHRRRAGAEFEKWSRPPQEYSECEGDQGISGNSASEDIEQDAPLAGYRG